MKKRLIQLIVGHWILTLGISLIVLSNYGTGAWDTVFIGLSRKFGLTVGTWLFITQIGLIFLNAILLKEKPQWKSLYGILLGGIAIDFWLELVFKNVTVNGFYLRISLFLFGIWLLAFGISIYIRTNIFNGPIDGLMLTTSKKLNVSLRTARTINEFVASIIGFLLGGPVGIGTIIIALLVGYFIQWNIDFIENIKKKWNLQVIY